MPHYYDEPHETMGRAARATLQAARLQAMVARVYERVPLYRTRLSAAGIAPADIRSLDDLAQLPFTVKTDFRDTYPFGLFAVPLPEVVRLHASSGTTGKATVVGYTRADLDLWAGTMARTLTMGGATAHDIIQVAYGYGLFTGGLGAHYGVEKLGATVVPMSGGNSRRQLQLMADFGTTMVCCTPSYMLQLAEEAQEMGLDPRTLKLKAGFFGAEPWSHGMRAAIEERFQLTAYDIYGLSEVIGPGVAAECSAHCGLHVFEDHFYPEIIDPVSGKVLPDGRKGELVFTCFTKECLPLIRYRTRDITSLDHRPCPCGRTLVRMARVSGRTDDMLIIRGVNVFPSQIESVLLSQPEVEPHYQLVVTRHGMLDELEVQVELRPELFSDEVKNVEALRQRLTAELETILCLHARVTFVEAKSIPRSAGKAVRVLDRRGQ